MQTGEGEIISSPLPKVNAQRLQSYLQGSLTQAMLLGDNEAYEVDVLRETDRGKKPLAECVRTDSAAYMKVRVRNIDVTRFTAQHEINVSPYEEALVRAEKAPKGWEL